LRHQRLIHTLEVQKKFSIRRLPNRPRQVGDFLGPLRDRQIEFGQPRRLCCREFA
jgi:hypothetical protein